jgi:hypothetical protein
MQHSSANDLGGIRRSASRVECATEVSHGKTGGRSSAEVMKSRPRRNSTGACSRGLEPLRPPSGGCLRVPFLRMAGFAIRLAAVVRLPWRTRPVGARGRPAATQNGRQRKNNYTRKGDRGGEPAKPPPASMRMLGLDTRRR